MFDSYDQERDVKQALSALITSEHSVAFFDSWTEKEVKICKFIADKKFIRYEDTIFFVNHREGGGCGMGEYPARYIVTKCISITEIN